MPFPTLLPKEKREERRVFLPKKLWKALDECAEFHQAAFDLLDAKESVSRNDLIDAFMRWAIDAYWEQHGGRPTGEKDRAEKVKRFAESMRKIDSK
jgi:predicted ArsR family transcriptional regulator